MRYLGFVACASFSLLAANAAMAQSAAPTAATPVAVVPEKKICRTEEVTGSNLSETQCHTKSEWAQISKQHEAEIHSMQDSRGWNSNGH